MYIFIIDFRTIFEFLTYDMLYYDLIVARDTICIFVYYYIFSRDAYANTIEITAVVGLSNDTLILTLSQYIHCAFTPNIVDWRQINIRDEINETCFKLAV